jgi:hypothetical protein
MGGAEPVLTSLVRLAGGPKSITSQIDMDLYAAQAAEYDKLVESQWDQILQGLVVMRRSHPLLSVRSREIRSWCHSPEFAAIMNGAVSPAQTADRTSCPACGSPIQPTWRFCRHCGTRLDPAAASAATGGDAD